MCVNRVPAAAILKFTQIHTKTRWRTHAYIDACDIIHANCIFLSLDLSFSKACAQACVCAHEEKLTHQMIIDGGTCSCTAIGLCKPPISALCVGEPKFTANKYSAGSHSTAEITAQQDHPTTPPHTHPIPVQLQVWFAPPMLSSASPPAPRRTAI